MRALEDDDFGQLPGRTFIRGFARNYARLMQLDPNAIVAALPEADDAHALDRPTIGSSTRPMGELPESQQARGIAWSRWAIPLLIAALIGVAAVYQFTSQGGLNLPDITPAAKRAPVDPIGPGVGTPLPNPATGSDATSAQSTASEPARDTGSATPSAAGAPATTSGPVPSQSLPITTATPPATQSAVPPGASPEPAQATLVINYRGASWTEVRDANGQRLLVGTGVLGTSETVSGTPPFELTLGNAEKASIVWRGAPFDLAPHVKGNVARVRLP